MTRKFLPAFAMVATLALPSLAPAETGKVKAAETVQEIKGVEKTALEITDEARKEAAQIFTTRCGACHGATGAGDGLAAVALNPKPRSFLDAEWQKTAKDEEIETIILKGGPAVGLSPLMPPNPDLVKKPVIVAALREHIRNLTEK
ncbi:MAG: hypothetical protein CME07_04800 [Gemmatimonadetes bacterium]|nr:hypothetical protein [Gemmatimonadota bacterium]